MSLLDSLRLSLDSMDFLQLGLAFAALLAYAIALSPSFDVAARAGAFTTALLSAAGFAAASPEWMAGVVLMALGVVGFALFAASSWLLSSLLGVVETRGRLTADLPFTRETVSLGLHGRRATSLRAGRRTAPLSAPVS